MDENKNVNEGSGENNATGGGAPANGTSAAGQPVAAQPAEHMFTQADLDRIVAERVRREREKYKDYDDLKSKAAKLAEIEQAQMTEAERALARLSEIEAQLAHERVRADDKLIHAAFTAEAAKLGAVHPSDAFALADLTNVHISDDDEVTGVAEQVRVMVEAGRLPTAAAKPLPPKLDGGAGSGERPTARTQQLSPEELEMAHKLRLTPEQYTKGKTRKE